MTHLPDTLVDIPAARRTSALMSRSRRERRRRGALVAAILTAVGLALSHETATAQGGGTLRVAMTASDIPTTTGMPNNGFEGMRFLGYPIFEGLTLLGPDPRGHAGRHPARASPRSGRRTRRTRPSGSSRCAAASSSTTAPTSTPTRSSGTSSASTTRSPSSSRPQGGAISRARNSVAQGVAQDRRLHRRDHHEPPGRATSPTSSPTRLIASPTQFEKTGASWAEFAKAPAGTGPFKITDVKPRVSVELVEERRLLGQEQDPEDRQDAC